MTKSAVRPRIRLFSAVFVMLAGLYVAVVSEARDVVIVSLVTALCGLVLIPHLLGSDKASEA